MSGNESRLQAISNITNRQKTTVHKSEPIDKIWATDVFNLAKMEEALNKSAFKAFKQTVQTGAPLDPAVTPVTLVVSCGVSGVSWAVTSVVLLRVELP